MRVQREVLSLAVGCARVTPTSGRGCQLADRGGWTRLGWQSLPSRAVQRAKLRWTDGSHRSPQLDWHNYFVGQAEGSDANGP